MSDGSGRGGRGRGPASGSSGAGDADYDWLYGRGAGSSRDRGESYGADPEPTRVMRAQSGGHRYEGYDTPDERPRERPRDRPGGRSTPPPAAPPRRTQPAPRRRRRGAGWKRLVLLLVLAYIAFLVLVPLITLGRIQKVDLGESTVPDQPGTNYLLVGSDSRKGLSRAEKRKLGVGGVSDTGQRTDTIMVLHTGSGPSVLTSIPRDSLVPIPGHGTNKINAAFAYGGPQLLARTIEQNTGLHIDHYVEIGFGGFVNAVDAVGGVRVCPTTAIKDPRANLDIQAGCQKVDGVTALGYSRSRHAFALGDVARAQHQREVIGAIGSKVKSPATVLNPFRYLALNQAAADSLTVSSGTGPLALGRFAWAMTRVSGGSGLTCGIPIRSLAVYWDPTRARRFLHFLKEDDVSDMPRRLCTPSGFPKGVA